MGATGEGGGAKGLTPSSSVLRNMASQSPPATLSAHNLFPAAIPVMGAGGLPGDFPTWGEGKHEVARGGGGGYALRPPIMRSCFSAVGRVSAGGHHHFGATAGGMAPTRSSTVFLARMACDVLSKAARSAREALGSLLAPRHSVGTALVLLVLLLQLYVLVALQQGGGGFWRWAPGGRLEGRGGGGGGEEERTLFWTRRLEDLSQEMQMLQRRTGNVAEEIGMALSALNLQQQGSSLQSRDDV